MNRVGVGRTLIASLHQGISDLMPMRLEFYENWLNPTGLRDGRIGLAPLAAVLSFLRQEGAPYDLVTARAGQYAAQWTFDNLSPFQRAVVRALPVSLRTRVALHLTRQVVRLTFFGSHAALRLRKGQGTITMRTSVFCSVRAPSAGPLCGYYAAALERSLTLVSVNGAVAVRSCRGAGAASCVIAVSLVSGQGS